MSSYFSSYLRTFCSKVREHLGRMTEGEIYLAALGAVLEIVHDWVLDRSTTDDITHVCGNDVVLVCLSQGMVRQWFALAKFRVCVVCVATQF